jgi:hypothetical protein
VLLIGDHDEFRRGPKAIVPAPEAAYDGPLAIEAAAQPMV